jgi:hypothetical protein
VKVRFVLTGKKRWRSADRVRCCVPCSNLRFNPNWAKNAHLGVISYLLLEADYRFVLKPTCRWNSRIVKRLLESYLCVRFSPITPKLQYSITPALDNRQSPFTVSPESGIFDWP